LLLPWTDAAFGVLVTCLLAAGAVWGRALTLRAGVVASLFGAVVVVLAGFAFLLILALFVVLSAMSTRYRFEEKRRRHVQEGTAGERGVSNVLAHIVVPAALVLTAWIAPGVLPGAPLAVLYVAALAFGTSDTAASEFGVLAGGARSILTGAMVPRGTNGGVSGLGEVAAGAGALVTAAASLGLLALFSVPYGSAVRLLLVAAVAGFLGCQADSVVGELFENRGWLSKGGTNVLGMVASVAIAAALLLAIGGWG
jgi:uncharacterized protein (TIGR00297 family)